MNKRCCNNKYLDGKIRGGAHKVSGQEMGGKGLPRPYPFIACSGLQKLIPDLLCEIDKLFLLM